jgi:ParB family transcriptional regulator, chromosome partitioning protein
MSSGKRRDELKALFTGRPGGPIAPETKSAEPPSAAATPTASPEPARAASGAVRAMGLSLGSLARDAEEARNLREAFEMGDRIVELDCALVESSFVEDRFARGEADTGFMALVDSIREAGQQVPILVRPHPQKTGQYQTAYGHRRLAAVRSLSRRVRAIVKPLSDDELVLAQGKENAERRDLTFIERAFFAQALVKRGFTRKVVEDALGVQKSEVSRLMQVADSVPIQFAHAIGPAPKAGRERWMALGAFFAKEAASVIADDEIHSERFRLADTNRRFQILFDRLARKQKPKPDRGEPLTGRDGKAFGKVYAGHGKPRIEFNAPVPEEFLSTVMQFIEEAWSARKDVGKG